MIDRCIFHSNLPSAWKRWKLLSAVWVSRNILYMHLPSCSAVWLLLSSYFMTIMSVIIAFFQWQIDIVLGAGGTVVYWLRLLIVIREPGVWFLFVAHILGQGVLPFCLSYPGYSNAWIKVTSLRLVLTTDVKSILSVSVLCNTSLCISLRLWLFQITPGRKREVGLPLTLFGRTAFYIFWWDGRVN